MGIWEGEGEERGKEEGGGRGGEVGGLDIGIGGEEGCWGLLVGEGGKGREGREGR